MTATAPAAGDDALILGIETSCDETSAAVVRAGHEICANIVASQDDLHRHFGGVVPEVASRRHCETITAIVEAAIKEAAINWNQLAGIAVTNGPGLVGSLLVGVAAAKGYALATGLPIVAVNHIEAHIFANFIHHRGKTSSADPQLLPAICLVASGGHTDIIIVRKLGDYTIAGWTRDDAAGEALDKAARVMGLGYPGGPVIDRLAQSADPDAFQFPRPKIDDSHDFSFSGLKTALLRKIEELQAADTPPDDDIIADIAASYQEAVVDCLVRNTKAAAEEYSARQVLVAGGVAANSRLRHKMSSIARELSIPISFPQQQFCTDNAAMIAAAGFFHARNTGWSDLNIDVFSAMPIAEHIGQ